MVFPPSSPCLSGIPIHCPTFINYDDKMVLQSDWPANKCPDVNVIHHVTRSGRPKNSRRVVNNSCSASQSDAFFQFVYFVGPINAIVTFTHVSLMNDRIILSQNSSKRRRDVLSTFCERLILQRPLIFYIPLIFGMSRLCRN